jgi:hypothetical protein
MMNYRVILYHKHHTSARTRFLKYDYNSVLAFEPLAKLAQILESDMPKTAFHPAIALKQIEGQLGLETAILKPEGSFNYYVDVPGGPVQIILACITTIDPPFEHATKIGGEFIDLMQARGLPPVELQLLRHAYELVLGG